MSENYCFFLCWGFVFYYLCSSSQIHIPTQTIPPSPGPPCPSNFREKSFLIRRMFSLTSYWAVCAAEFHPFLFGATERNCIVWFARLLDLWFRSRKRASNIAIRMRYGGIWMHMGAYRFVTDADEYILSHGCIQMKNGLSLVCKYAWTRSYYTSKGHIHASN